MAKLKLSKSSLLQQRTQLQLYRKLLPSLDMKRRQLMAEQKKAREEFEAAGKAVTALEARIGAELPMLAATEIDLEGPTSGSEDGLSVDGQQTEKALSLQEGVYESPARGVGISRNSARVRSLHFIGHCGQVSGAFYGDTIADEAEYDRY